MAESCPELPQDLIYEIFLLLPVESIGRCRCISRPWRRQLSSPQFTKSHLNRHKHDLGLIITYSESSWPLDLSLGDPWITTLRGGDNDGGVLRLVDCHLTTPFVYVEATCHGLVLLCQRGGVRRVLVNPITLEATELPILDIASPISCSLGYDGLQDDYKIVSVSYGEDKDDGYPMRNRVDICSVRTKTWRRLANSPYNHCQSETVVNGYIHWICEGYGYRVICAIDLCREELEEVPFPTGVSPYPHMVELADVNGSLAMLVFTPGKLVDIWVMKDCFWIKIGTEGDHRRDVGFALSSRVICILGEDELLVRNEDGSQLVAYNWRNQVRKDLLVVPRTVTSFRPSLVSPIYERS